MHPQAVSALLARATCHHLFVHASSALMPELSFDELPLEPDSISHWKAQLDRYGRLHQLYPPSVLLGGFPFGLGTDYDEACCGYGVSSLYGLGPSGRPEDLLRDRVVLLIDAPPDLERLVYEAGAFTALCRTDAKERAASFNREACISLSTAYPRETLEETIALDVGGADLVVSYAEKPFGADMHLMADILHGLLVHVGDIEDFGTVTLKKRTEEDVMHQLVNLVRRVRQFGA